MDILKKAYIIWVNVVVIATFIIASLILQWCYEPLPSFDEQPTAQQEKILEEC